MAIPDLTTERLQSIAEHDFAATAAIADLVDEWGSARVAADGRAPGLAEFNRVALVRANPETVDALLTKAERFFQKRRRPTAVALDPGATPEDLPERLAARGFRPAAEPQDLLLWDPDAPHLFTAPEVYMTLATNANLDAWLDIATGGMEPGLADQARTMLTLAFRAPGFTFWFGLFGGVPVGACPLWVGNGLGRVGPIRVTEGFRRKGVGLALVNYVTRQSRKDGAQVTYLYNDHGGPATGICRTAGYHAVADNAHQTWVLSDIS